MEKEICKCGMLEEFHPVKRMFGSGFICGKFKPVDTSLSDKFILDACCGGKQMWEDKNHKNTVFIDIRKEKKGFVGGKNDYLEVNPDIIMDFRKLDFPNESFKLIVFDPPHMKTLGKTSMFRKMYGNLDGEWKVDLKKGFEECWRVLEDYGILLFKWSDTEIKLKEIYNLFPIKPLIRNVAGTRPTGKTYWFTFMKIPNNNDTSKSNLKEQTKQSVVEDRN